MAKKILLAAVLVIAVLVAVVAAQPSTYRVERSATIAAPPDVVYAQIADFHRWAAWSPWAKADPSMKTTYSGAPTGPGAVCDWSGNDRVGAGTMTIVAAKPGELLEIQLQFRKPWKSASSTEFALQPVAGGTRVAWIMSGGHDFVGKAFSLIVSIDKMFGKDFEQGLRLLGAVAEAEARKGATLLPAVATPHRP